MTYQSQTAVLAVLATAIVLFFACYALAAATRAYNSVRRDRVRMDLWAARNKLYLAAANDIVDPRSATFARVTDIIGAIIPQLDAPGWLVFFALEGAKQKPTDNVSRESTEQMQELSSEARAVYLEVLGEVVASLRTTFEINSRIVRFYYWLGTLQSTAAKPGVDCELQHREHSVDEVSRLYGLLRASAGTT